MKSDGLCSSQNSRAPEMLGTGLGDRLRDDSRSVFGRAGKIGKEIGPVRQEPALEPLVQQADQDLAGMQPLRSAQPRT
jgi:hypothetical protein